MAKMLNEEKALRYYLREFFWDEYSGGMKPQYRRFARRLRALVRAVREECARECDGFAGHYRALRDKGPKRYRWITPGGQIDIDTMRMFVAEECAAAIRGKGREG